MRHQDDLTHDMIDHFSLKNDWNRPRRWVCFFIGHSIVERPMKLTYQRRNGYGPWMNYEQSMPVTWCIGCRSILKVNIRIKSQGKEMKIAAINLVELE